MIRPNYLKTGDTIGIVSVSSKILPDSLDSMRFELIRSWGLNIKFGNHLYDKDGGWFSATDTARAADLRNMIDDKSVKAIIFYKGGYGSVRILDYIDFKSLVRNPKWLVGYSDVTIMHYAAQNAGVESLHGTMPVSFAKDSTYDESAASLRDALFGETKRYYIAPNHLNQKGVATGRLTGGNLSLIYAANGTDIDNDLKKPSVLFIEDVSENIYQIDRMLQNMKRTGKLERAKAIIVGHFTGTKDEARFGKTAEELISEYTSKLGIPVIFGFPGGHERPNIALYMGRTVRVTVREEGGLIEFI